MAVSMLFNVNDWNNKSLLTIVNTWYPKELRNAVHKGFLTRSPYRAVNT